MHFYIKKNAEDNDYMIGYRYVACEEFIKAALGHTPARIRVDAEVSDSGNYIFTFNDDGYIASWTHVSDPLLGRGRQLTFASVPAIIRSLAKKAGCPLGRIRLSIKFTPAREG